MIPLDHNLHRPPRREWWIYESSDRWLRAVRRFAPEYFDDACEWSIVGKPIDADLRLGKGPTVRPEQGRRVLMWQVQPSHLPQAAAAIARLRLWRPDDLQIAAVSDLTVNAQMALSEIGIATTIQHPEQLPSLRHMIRVFFGDETTSHQPDHLSA